MLPPRCPHPRFQWPPGDLGPQADAQSLAPANPISQEVGEPPRSVFGAVPSAPQLAVWGAGPAFGFQLRTLSLLAVSSLGCASLISSILICLFLGWEAERLCGCAPVTPGGSESWSPAEPLPEGEDLGVALGHRPPRAWCPALGPLSLRRGETAFYLSCNLEDR